MIPKNDLTKILKEVTETQNKKIVKKRLLWIDVLIKSGIKNKYSIEQQKVVQTL